MTGLPWLLQAQSALTVSNGAVAGLSWAPSGGTVSSLASDPNHPDWLQLGTTTGVVYHSTDAGAHWSFEGRVVVENNWVVAALVADRSTPDHWYAALWSWGAPTGGVAESLDGGRSWRTLMTGHAVRALALAPSDANELVAAALDGVYRSRDRGETWQRISPVQNAELRNVQSVAIDPVNANEIYVGTWHLPWKTFDGGHNWIRISQGLIDDSDVFQIVVDPQQPATVYLSACSGIYRSDSSGIQFRKIQGIPYTARRTTALVQDPAAPTTIYAGTTAGLWISRDAGATWNQMTPATLSINAVVPLGGGRIVLGTEHAGIYVSEDNGAHFVASNEGFVNRQVAAMAAGRNGYYESIAGDNAWGGIFASQGAEWRQLPPLPGEQWATTLWEASGGLLAGTAHGLYRYEQGRWVASTGLREVAIAQLAGDDAAVFAATERGLFESDDGGLEWRLLPAAPAGLEHVLVDGDWLFIAGGEAGGRRFVLRSPDRGVHFRAGALYVDAPVNQLSWTGAATPAGPQVILAATASGLYRSTDMGGHWALVGHGMGQQAISTVEQHDGDLVASGPEPETWYRSADLGQSWQPCVMPEPQGEWLRAAATLPPSAVAAVEVAPASTPAARQGHRR